MNQDQEIIMVPTKDFDLADAEAIIQNDLDQDCPIGCGRMPSQTRKSPPKLPVFYANHTAISLDSKYNQVSNWGVRKVSLVKEDKKP